MLDSYIVPLLEGLYATVLITLASAGVGLVFAFLGGLSRLSKNLLVRSVAYWYIEIFRNTSVLVQLFWVFYVFPLWGIFFNSWTTAIIVLGLNIGAYGSDAVRTAFQTIPKSQGDAISALGLSRMQAFRYVLFPQAIPELIPSFNNLAIILLKATSLVSLITVSELTFVSQNLRATEGKTALILFIVLVIYYILSVMITSSLRKLSRHIDAKHGQARKPRKRSVSTATTRIRMRMV